LVQEGSIVPVFRFCLDKDEREEGKALLASRKGGGVLGTG